MVHQFLKEESAANADADKERHMVIVMCLLQMQAMEHAAPILRASAAGKRNRSLDKDWRGMPCYTTTNFSNYPIYNAKDFCWRYRMNKNIFMKIMHVI
jgi:hypothetical protein